MPTSDLFALLDRMLGGLVGMIALLGLLAYAATRRD